MANPLQEKILELTRKEIGKKVSATKGVVINYNNVHNAAQVEIDNPHGGGKLFLPHVPIQVVGGLHVPGPFPGDEVWLEFTAGNISMPTVVGFADRGYHREFREKKLKHRRQGAYLPDALSRRVR